jgi:hypothetical protein
VTAHSDTDRLDALASGAIRIDCFTSYFDAWTANYNTDDADLRVAIDRCLDAIEQRTATALDPVPEGAGR